MQGASRMPRPTTNARKTDWFHPVGRGLAPAMVGADSSAVSWQKKDCKKHLQNRDTYAIIARHDKIRAICPFTIIQKEVNKMKEGIHPNYEQTTIRCACGAVIETGSTKQDIKVEICSKCHPFYTGKQKLVDTGGRVERFNKKFGLK